MNDVQMQMMSLQRHHRILARAHAEETAAAKTAPAFAETLAAAAPTPIAPAAPAEAPAPAPEPTRTLALSNPPATAAVPQLSPDQAALLAASLGATLPEAPATAPVTESAKTAALPDMSDDQMSTLMSAFGHEAAPAQIAAGAAPESPYPQTAAAMAASAIPISQGDNLRYFPINRAAQSETQANAAPMTASDTYLRAMQQMERNLGAYGGLATANGR